MNQTQPIAPTTVHFVLQGKGGVGKSFVSAILAQYLRSKSATLHCLDTGTSCISPDTAISQLRVATSIR